MQVREIDASELGELLSLYGHLHETDDPLPESGVVRDVWQRIQADPNQRYFGVFAGDRLLSACALCIVPNLTRGCRPYAIMENVVTHGDHRRKGYGKAVLTAALQYAWSRDCYKVMLLTGRKSEAVYRFYESVGFNRYAKQAFLAKPPETQLPENPDPYLRGETQ